MKKIKYRNVRQYFSYRRIQQKAGESGAACTPQGCRHIWGSNGNNRPYRVVLQITADMDFYGDGSGNTLYSRGDRRVFFRERKEKEISRCGCIYSSDDLFI